MTPKYKQFSPESEEYFQTGNAYIERGKGHGREGRMAAHRMFEKAAAKGHLEAKKVVAFANLFGDYARWSISEAKSTFEELEKNGSPDAQLALGFMHGAGIGVEKSNQAKALVYYMFSALGGNPLAQMAMVGFFQFKNWKQLPKIQFVTGLSVQSRCRSSSKLRNGIVLLSKSGKVCCGQCQIHYRTIDPTNPLN